MTQAGRTAQGVADGTTGAGETQDHTSPQVPLPPSKHSPVNTQLAKSMCTAHMRHREALGNPKAVEAALPPFSSPN
jgi:hypothetical protein